MIIENKTISRSGDVGVRKRSRLEQIIEMGRKHRQIGLHLFIWYWYQSTGKGSSLDQLHNFYNRIAQHSVREETVQKQLQLMKAKGLVREEGGKYYPVPVPKDVLIKLFDTKRSRAGKSGAVKRLRQIIYRGEMPAAKDLHIF